MAANTGDFKNAGSNARGEEIGIIQPVNPTPEGKVEKRDAAVYVSPADFARSRREAAKSGVVVNSRVGTAARTTQPKKETSLDNDLALYTQMSNKKAIGMNDTMTIAHSFVSKLETAHAALTGATSIHKDHPNLPEAGRLIGDAKNLLTFAEVMKRNQPVLDESGNPVLTKKNQPAQKNQTPAAWEAIEKVGGHIQRIHKLLSAVSPSHVEGISHTHIMDHGNGTHSELTFTPSSGLKYITKAPSDFRGQGRAVQTTSLAGRRFTVPQNVEANLAVRKREQELGVSDTEALRPEAVRAFRKKTARTKRVRKILRTSGQGVRTGELAPKSNLPLVESLGEAAVQPSRVGDYGGSERGPIKPGENYPKTAERLATRKLRRARRKQSQALSDLRLAEKSSEQSAPTALKKAKGDVLSAAAELQKNIGEVKAARSRDITYAVGTPKTGTRRFPKPAKDGKK